jgi:hypothetical protein
MLVMSKAQRVKSAASPGSWNMATSCLKRSKWPSLATASSSSAEKGAYGNGMALSAEPAASSAGREAQMVGRSGLQGQQQACESVEKATLLQ